MLKIGGQVETARACGALGAEGTLDLPAGTTGKLLGVRGEHAKVELASHAGDGTAVDAHPHARVVYLATEYLVF